MPVSDRIIHAHVPFLQLEDNLGFILEKGVHPEIFLAGDLLDTVIPEQVESVAASLQAAKLTCTIHAPFIDLNPGSEEKLIRETTRLRFRQICVVAWVLRPKVMVFHPGYDKWRYGEKQSSWLKHSIDTFTEVLAATEQTGCNIAVENIFEEEPSTLLALLEAVNHPRFRHCFDVGHWNLFSANNISLPEWFTLLGAQMAEVHIHDNNGLRDDHAPVGEGGIDFEQYFALLKRYAPQAVWTLEAHSRSSLERAVKSIAPFATKD
ncbi:MAG: sugar phosphate isomerase/epimerase [Geobacter sp.]|nr:sugar phosphate isomerase/epimerase [Geobacter sp.]